MANDIYGSVADSKTYFSDRGITAWAVDDDATLTAILLRATEFIDGRYGTQFPGVKFGLRAQIREWPRTGAVDRNCDYIPYTEIPVEVIHATYEAALREQANPGTLTPDIDYTARRQSVRVEGAIAVTYASLPLRAEAFRKIMTIVDAIIAPVLTGSGVASSLSGKAYRV
jgi:hypothetical protein